MNTRVRTSLQSMRAGPKNDKEMEKEKKTVKQGKRTAPAKGLSRLQSRRERKLALQQDIDKLRKKLRHEESVHRALERAFTRPLGALPRLPPYLPSRTLELLAEVAVLEEEVVRLEEQVVNFRQGLYQEAIIVSSSKKTRDNSPDSKSNNMPNSESSVSIKPNVQCDAKGPPTNRIPNGRNTQRKQSTTPLPSQDSRPGKENQSSTNLSRNCKQSPVKKAPKLRNPTEKSTDTKTECKMTNQNRVKDSNAKSSEAVPQLDNSSGPNKLSEEILKCLLNIFSQTSSSNNAEEEQGMSPSVSGSSSSSFSSSEDTDSRDPYGILEYGKRDIGPYKHLRVVDAGSFHPNLVENSSLLTRRLKVLMRKLAAVDLVGLSHQQKLAFWINVYNSCMMNAFLEQGLPSNPQMLVALMPKATINVGGQLLSAMTIEHFILRLPYNVKHAYPKGMKSDDVAMRGIFGLEWPEPLVTFALSCGSWSSPAVRIYTASHVEEELETAKKHYLQASVCISDPTKLAIPKLIHWYLQDFAKDVESLMDWICMQLPNDLRNNAVKCLDLGRGAASPPRPVQVLPYEFRFRYLLAL